MTTKLFMFLISVALVQGQVDFWGSLQKWTQVSAITNPSNSTESDSKSPMDIIKISEVQNVATSWIPKFGDKGSENSTSDKQNSTSGLDFVKLTQIDNVKEVFSQWIPNFGGASSDNSTTSDKQNSTSPVENFIKITKVGGIRETVSKWIPKFADETSDNSTSDKQ